MYQEGKCNFTRKERYRKEPKVYSQSCFKATRHRNLWKGCLNPSHYAIKSIQRMLIVNCAVYTRGTLEQFAPLSRHLDIAHSANVKLQFIDMDSVVKEGFALNWDSSEVRRSPTLSALHAEAKSAVSHCTTCDELLGAIKQHLDCLSPSGLVFALAKLTNVKKGPTYAECLGILHPRLSEIRMELGSRNITSLVITLAYIEPKIVPEHWHINEMVNKVQPDLFLLTPNRLCLLSRALAVLRAVPSPEWQEEWCKVILSKMPLINPSYLSLAFWALVRLGHKPSSFWLDTVLDALYHNMSSLPFHSIANMLWALSQLKFSPKAEWWEALYRVTLEKLQTVQANPLSATIRALAVLRSTPPKPWLDAAIARAAIIMPQLHPKQDVAFLTALSSWHHGPPPEVLGSMLTACQGRLKKYTAAQQVLLLSALGRLYYLPSQEWLAAYVAGARKQIREYSPSHIVSTLVTFARWKRMPSRELAVELLTLSQSNLRYFTADQIGQLVWSVCALEIRVRHRWRKAVLDQFAAHCGNATSHNLAAFVSSLPKLKLSKSDRPLPESSGQSALHALVRESKKRLTTMEPKHLYLLLLGFSSLPVNPGMLFLRAHARAASKCVTAFTPPQKEHMANAYRRLLATSKSKEGDAMMANMEASASE